MLANTDKLYYSISETSEIINETVATVRFWENGFEQINPKKNKRGVRYFTPKDLEVLKQIKFLTRVQGYTLEGAKLQLKHNNLPSIDKKQEAIERLKKIRNYLSELKEVM